MLKRVIVALGMLAGAGLGDLYAQDPEFTQFYANPLYLNPAFAGTARCPRICLNYRNQWPGITGTFVTYSASYDQHIDAISGGVGFLFTNDRAGMATINTTNISGIYSYQLNITREFSMKVGLQATYAQKSVDWSKLNFGDMIDPRRGFIYNTNEVPNATSKTNVDFSAGLLGYSRRYFFGAAVHHITEPDEGFLGPSKLPMKYTGHAGAVIPIGGRYSETSISPNVLFQKQQDFQQLNLGIYFSKGPLVGGMWYRNQDSFILLLGFQQDLFKFGYSYDVTVSKLTNATAGSHELSFQMQFECKPKKKKFRTVSCPSF
ncbi:MAG: type IX secretion system membrane protein PorP/SprF [Bacteroidetes bacterium]|jgi:type IX secretion system PorP/SprF family membrane protein|nr:type IX secretion system membrane protein PorP/SprF [Bacteroidota bacterium]